MYDNINALAEGRDTDFRCPAGGHLVEIAASGEILGCEVLPKEQASLGHLADHEYDLGRILRGSKAAAFRERIARERCACSFECAHITAATIQLPRTILPRRQRAG
jgi:MoaA/NifB/PqqE/SkfB family radical SAM enzyme